MPSSSMIFAIGFFFGSAFGFDFDESASTVFVSASLTVSAVFSASTSTTGSTVVSALVSSTGFDFLELSFFFLPLSTAYMG